LWAWFLDNSSLSMPARRTSPSGFAFCKRWRPPASST
jgi:hypothetical protein